ncbi:hypothetical protein CI610_03252 [invertebrate metagenome]|uniref:Uncharacterized protein n=1 Tax=invertebrate metagenome TaxID=1711999 RepID=A0A2H9T3P9_9ZZZZ
MHTSLGQVSDRLSRVVVVPLQDLSYVAENYLKRLECHQGNTNMMQM